MQVGGSTSDLDPSSAPGDELPGFRVLGALFKYGLHYWGKLACAEHTEMMVI
jgi:hypothetical protein